MWFRDHALWQVVSLYCLFFVVVVVPNKCSTNAFQTTTTTTIAPFGIKKEMITTQSPPQELLLLDHHHLHQQRRRVVSALWMKAKKSSSSNMDNTNKENNEDTKKKKNSNETNIKKEKNNKNEKENEKEKKRDTTTDDDDNDDDDDDDDEEVAKMKLIDPDEDTGQPVPFIDRENPSSYIECFPDSIITVKGIDYTIGLPCDYPVALCYFDAQQQLLPVELDDTIMDDIFPIAENIVEEEFGDELVLQRTPQTLTLVGELEEDDDDDDDDSDDEDDDDEDGDDEDVELLLSFEYEGRQYNLVRLLDPILLVGKPDDVAPTSGNRLLLTPQESATVMPLLEKLFLQKQDFTPEE